MGEIVNLRMARKARDRARAADTAQQNRARHGATRAERRAIEAEAERVSRTVEGARLAPEPEAD